MSGPTETGWYWARVDSDCHWAIVHYDTFSGGLTRTGDEHTGDRGDVCEWGPRIHEPPDPSKLYVASAEVIDGTQMKCEYDEAADRTVITIHGPAMRKGLETPEGKTLDRLVNRHMFLARAKAIELNGSA